MGILDIEQWIFNHHRSSYSLLVPSFTPEKWFECDLFGLTKAGFAVEFEIKHSRSDFMVDFQKTKTRYAYVPGQSDYNRIELRKHDLLANRDERGPTRFFYITPKDMIAISEIPEYAGSYEFREVHGRVCLSLRRDAPKLHGHKFPTDEINRIMKNMYFRYWNERRARREAIMMYQAYRNAHP